MNKDFKKKRQIGLIAQEVQDIIPEVVSHFETGEGEFLGLQYGHLTAVLIKGIQEQQEMIESQKKEITALHSMVKQMGKQLADVTAAMKNKEAASAQSTAFVE